jgi:hypothetical protein
MTEGAPTRSPGNVIENVWIRDLNATTIGHYFSTPLQYMYTPLVSLSYAFDFQLGGLDPTAYHVTNLLLHLANTAAVFGVFSSLTRRAFVAHFVTVAFAIHPMNVDGVAWISTRSGLLATLFSLLALLAYIRYVDTQRRWYLGAASVSFLFATFSKSPAVVLPLVLFLVDYYRRRIEWPPRPANLGRLLVEKLPFLAIAITMGIVALNFRIDTVNPYGYTILDRFFIVCAALVAYIGKLLFPFGLSFAHAYPPKNGAFLPWYLYLAPVVLAVGTWLLVRVTRPRRIVVFGLSFFFITIILSQTVLLLDNFQANRYAYLPYLGLFLILGHRRICSSTARRRGGGCRRSGPRGRSRCSPWRWCSPRVPSRATGSGTTRSASHPTRSTTSRTSPSSTTAEGSPGTGPGTTPERAGRLREDDRARSTVLPQLLLPGHHEAQLRGLRRGAGRPREGGRELSGLRRRLQRAGQGPAAAERRRRRPGRLLRRHRALSRLRRRLSPPRRRPVPPRRPAGRLRRLEKARSLGSADATQADSQSCPPK